MIKHFIIIVKPLSTTSFQRPQTDYMEIPLITTGQLQPHLYYGLGQTIPKFYSLFFIEVYMLIWAKIYLIIEKINFN